MVSIVPFLSSSCPASQRAHRFVRSGAKRLGAPAILDRPIRSRRVPLVGPLRREPGARLGFRPATRRHQAKIRRSEAIPSLPGERLAMTYTIFEGTSEIQRLVIARSISGVHIP